eukprot:UN25359
MFFLLTCCICGYVCYHKKNYQNTTIKETETELAIIRATPTYTLPFADQLKQIKTNHNQKPNPLKLKLPSNSSRWSSTNQKEYVNPRMSLYGDEQTPSRTGFADDYCDVNGWGITNSFGKTGNSYGNKLDILAPTPNIPRNSRKHRLPKGNFKRSAETSII